MTLKDKIKQLRIARNMTQEAVAEQLGVSSQTVSKWERGLLSPDISLLPKIALLFCCSIDSMFDMNAAWGIEHRKEFEAKMHELLTQKDWNGAYDAWICEIELNPDHYSYYPDVMLHVLRQKFFDDDHVQKMLSLAEHAEKCCTDDDIRNEIYRIMLQICSESQNPAIKEKATIYYKKLPMLRHSREVYAKFVMDTDEYRHQIKKNIIYMADLAECAIRQLILPEMELEEKLYYYKKAAALYETVLDDKFAGFYDLPLLSDYKEIAVLLVNLERIEEAREYVDHILMMLEKHMSNAARQDISKLLYATSVPNTVSAEQNCIKILNHMLHDANLEMFKTDVSKMLERYTEYVSDSSKKLQ